jgi:hypothetical protein
MRRHGITVKRMSVLLMALFFMVCCAAPTVANESIKLSDEQVENIIRLSYQYVAMYNVNNKFAYVQGGWNTVVADTELKDHTMREIARPNNDTLYVACMLDLHKDFTDSDETIRQKTLTRKLIK